MKKLISLIAALAILVGVLAGCAGVDVTKIATINGEDVLKSEYLFYCEQVGLNVASAYAQYGMDMSDIWNQTYDDEQTMGEYVKTQAFDQLKEVHVLKAKAEEMGITLTADEKAEVTENKKNLVASLGGAAAYNSFLAKVSLTDDKVIEILTDMTLAQKVHDEVVENDPDFKDVSEDDVAAYYEEKYMKAKHILILNTPPQDTEDAEAEEAPEEETEEEPLDEEEAAPEENAEEAVTEEATEDTEEAVEEEPVEEEVSESPEDYAEKAKERAQEILDQLIGGADFDTLMNQYSEDTGLSTNPDGYVFTDGAMVSEFEDAVKGLKAGEFTKELVESSYGYHIIERLELTREDSDFTENYDQYKEKYISDKWTELLDSWMEAADVQVNENVQNKVDLTKLYWGNEE